MATQRIVSRWDSSKVLFECEVPDGIESGLAMRHALEKAVEARANLSGANLYGAYLSGAYLYGANLYGANLYGANLYGANLYGANLYGANLYGANLYGANLSDAYLYGAYLYGANLSDAYLYGANLSGAKWRDGITINKRPIYVDGLHWRVVILDEHMQIGCELHLLSDWRSFDDRRIAEMDGRDALRFWRENKDALLALATASGRGAGEVKEAA